MNNKDLLEKFFRALRISLTNASSYSKDHPYFIQSVENFKIVLAETLSVLNPLKINITTSNIVVNREELPKNSFYDDLVYLLHQRKIKSIEIRSGADLGELVEFLSVISLPKKDIIKNGGINAILEDRILVHFTIEELDYSEFLHQEGQDCGDVWGYLLKHAAENKDDTKLEQLADDFGVLIKRSSQKDILETQAMPDSIGDFLVSLKEKNKEKFDKCSKDVFLWFLHNKKSLQDKELEKLAPILKSLNQDDFSSLLWEGIMQDDNFDNLSLQLFSKISEQKDPANIAQRFLSKINQSQYLKNNPHVVKRIKNLINTQNTDRLSDVYQHTLESLVKGISSSGELCFDQKILRENYRYIILNILAIGDDHAQVSGEILVNQLPVIWEDKDFDFLRSLMDLLKEKRRYGKDFYSKLEEKLACFIENIVLNDELAAQQEFLLDLVVISNKEFKFYLDKIFTAQKVTPQLLILFFKLFGQQLEVFYHRLEQRLQDLEFLDTLIEALGQVDSQISLAVLEHIYPFVNELIKVEILKVMVKLKKIDSNFLLQQLDTNSFVLRKTLFSILILDNQAKELAMEKLFGTHSFWGKNNYRLIENMQIISDLKFSQAIVWLQKLSQKKFFWNRKLSNKAKQVLGELNAY
ncbi:MAG: hypothetical protein WC543_01195 [Candidatus Omnitrophota bacterium]